MAREESKQQETEQRDMYVEIPPCHPLEPSTSHYFDSAVWLDCPRVSEQNAHYLARTWKFTGLDQCPRETRILPRKPWAAQRLQLRGCHGAPAGALRLQPRPFLQRILSSQSPAWHLSVFLSLP